MGRRTDDYLAAMVSRNPCVSIHDRHGRVKRLVRLKHELMKVTLRMFGGSKGKAASELGIRRNTVCRLSN